NQPHKLGWLNGVLYLELHPWLEGTAEATQQQDEQQLKEQIRQQIASSGAILDEQAVASAEIERNGIPVPITRQSVSAAVEPAAADVPLAAEPVATEPVTAPAAPLTEAQP
ncbi:MAG: hypothetical protein IT470_00745, partial [Pseudomonadales bacterium]|nr:hypothetical protein [Pseudomonadales bacterium]